MIKQIALKDILDKISALIEAEDYDLALSELNILIQKDENCISALKLRAQLFQKKNQMSHAINDYRRILKIEPENKEVIGAKLLLENILSMTSLDVYECTNTHLDPWD